MILLESDISNEAKEIVTNFDKYVKSFIDGFLDFGLNILIALIILVIGKFIIKMIMKIFSRFLNRINAEISVRKFLESLIKALCYVLLIIIMCDQVGIATTSFIAILGTAGLAIGLAFQGSLSNFAGGIIILLMKPFKVNDYIIDGGSGKEGTVSKIDLFYTSLITPDNKLVVIPNGSLANNDLTNFSAFDERRIDIIIGISYAADIKKAKETIEQICASNEYILNDKGISVSVDALTENSVVVGIRVWTRLDNFFKAKGQLNEQIKLALDEANIDIAYNQLDVHIKSESDSYLSRSDKTMSST